MKYKIVLYIEETDDDAGCYNNMESEFCFVGPYFDTLSEAHNLIKKMTNNLEVYLWYPEEVTDRSPYDPPQKD